MSYTVVLLTLAAAIAVGTFAWVRWGSTGGTVRAAVAVIRNTFFIIAGISMILGGWQVLGVLWVAFFTFLWLSAAATVKQDFRKKIAGT